MPGELFLDTNVLVYAFSGTEPEKRRRARDLLQRPGSCCSTQNLNELANVLIRKFRLPHTSVAAAIQDVAAGRSIHKVEVADIQRALTLSARYGFGYFDSLVVSAALSMKCSTLYTEDLQEGQVIEGILTIFNPFGEE
ncbi:MAG: PIN domain-containing protein [Magnetococcus sp. YQC-5]